MSWVLARFREVEAEGNGLVLYFVLKFDAAEDVPGGVQEGIGELKLQADGRAELAEVSDLGPVEFWALARLASICNWVDIVFLFPERKKRWRR